jgi:uncharacterized protein (TIGR00369 family)
MPETPITALEIREAMANSGFHTWMGIRVVDVGEGTIDLALDVAEHHMNLQGLVHGGVLATLADTAAGLAVRTTIEPGSGHVTVDLSMQYVRPTRGGTLHAHGSVAKRGSRFVFADADVTDEAGVLLARGRATISVSR